MANFLKYKFKYQGCQKKKKIKNLPQVVLCKKKKKLVGTATEYF